MNGIHLLLCGVAAPSSIRQPLKLVRKLWRTVCLNTPTNGLCCPLSPPFSDEEIVTPPADNLRPEEGTPALTILRFLLSLLSLPSPSHRPGNDDLGFCWRTCRRKHHKHRCHSRSPNRHPRMSQPTLEGASSEQLFRFPDRFNMGDEILSFVGVDFMARQRNQPAALP
jgi:hypothetical protein